MHIKLMLSLVKRLLCFYINSGLVKTFLYKCMVMQFQKTAFLKTPISLCYKIAQQSCNLTIFCHFHNFQKIFSHTFEYFLQDLRLKVFLQSDAKISSIHLYLSQALSCTFFILLYTRNSSYFSLFPMISIQSRKWKTALSITNLLVLLRSNSRNLLMHMTLQSMI